ncbi:hypothetical protein [Streptomyces sp. 2132.2]|uniref:hypothetical protein n=1 Tax=Streptomyces sp. 2132.2 TaxID=2485161 RepID=UPI000F48CE94|nr:hypothetical protein [Streptomyces sp. 2132.2]
MSSRTRLLCAAAILVCTATAGVASAKGGAGLDPRFGHGGVVVSSTAPGAGSDFANGLAIDGRRRIVVSGSSDLGGPGGVQWRVQRFTPDGAVDAAFGNHGTVLTPMSPAGGDDENIWRIALQSDGKILAVGHAITATGGEDFALARYLPDGRLDRSFGTGGKVFTTVAPGAGDDEAQAVQVQRDGRIVVAGFTGTRAGTEGRDLALVRYLPDGRLDPGFGAGGIVVRDVAGGRDQFKHMVLDGHGRIVAVGSADLGAGRGGTSFAVARYRPDGRPDAGFGSDGLVVTPMAAGDGLDLAEAVAIDGKGRLTVGGSADAGGPFDLALARYLSDGRPDGRFGEGGRVLTNVGPGATDEDLEGLVVQGDGAILVGGSTAPTEFLVDSDFLVGRYLPDGSPDRRFGKDGFVVTHVAPGTADDEIYDIAPQGPGLLVAAGECDRPATGRDVCLARYLVGGQERPRTGQEARPRR